MTAQEAWDAVLGELQLQVNKANFKSWLKPTKGLSCTNDAFVIGVPTAFVGEWLEKRWHSLIKKTLVSVVGRDLEIKFQIGPAAPERLEPRAPAPEPSSSHPTGNSLTAGSGLMSKYTFGNFYVSSSNSLAHAAALDVAQNPAKTYNPLFIYAGSGLGKTHLLHAIAHTGVASGYSVVYASGEQFTNEFVTSLRTHTLDDFRLKYRTPDILLMDDVQFFCGKEQTQETFFHAFNDLHNANHQIVISSDRPPKSLPSMEDRLVSRFEWGIMVGIAPPDPAGRLGILKSKSANLSVTFPDDALETLARVPFRNIRELEGCLNKVAATARLSHSAPTTELVRKIIDEMLPPQDSGTPAPEKIVEQVARHYNVTPQHILGRKGGRSGNLIRYITVYLLREESGMSLNDIGDYLGYKDHTSVSYGLNKIAGNLKTDKELKEAVDRIAQDLHRPAEE